MGAGLAFCLGFVLGILTSFGTIFLTYRLVQWDRKGIEFKPLVPDNNKMRAFTVGGKHVPKVRDDMEARKQELKKAEEKELTYG